MLMDDKSASSKSHLKTKYGLAYADLEALENHADLACLICGEPPVYTRGPLAGRERALQVDHDHKTGVVRGLLCPRCNGGLGGFRDNIRLLLSAVLYLHNAAANPGAPGYLGPVGAAEESIIREDQATLHRIVMEVCGKPVQTSADGRCLA